MLKNSRGLVWCSVASLAALAGVVAGCEGGGGRSSAGGPARSAVSYGETSALPAVQKAESFDAMTTLGYRAEWVGYAVMPGGRRVRYADVFDDVIAVHNSGNLLSVLESSTGAVRWSLELGSPLERFVGTARSASGDILACQQGEIMVLDAKTGVLKDRQRLAVIANTAPAVVGNMVIFGCPTGEVLAHNLISGYKQWGHMLSGTVTADPVRVGENNVAVVSAGGDVVILDARRGTQIGRSKIFGGSDAAPGASDSAVFVASLDQSVWGFSETGGRELWRVRTERPLREPPVFHEGNVYVAVPEQGLVCLSASDGVRQWTAAGVGGSVIGVRGGRLLVWDGRIATTIDPQRGDVIARVELPGLQSLNPDAFVDGNLFAVGIRGEVGKFSPRR